MKRIEQQYCRHCDAVMPTVKKSPNHILHLILSLLTGGFWLIIYALVAFETSFRSWRCQRCGKRV